jgi:hypothetical protein
VNQPIPRGQLHVGGDAVVDGRIETVKGIRLISSHSDNDPCDLILRSDISTYLEESVQRIQNTLYHDLYQRLSRQINADQRETQVIVNPKDAPPPPPPSPPQHQQSQPVLENMIHSAIAAYAESNERYLHSKLLMHQQEADERYVTPETLRSQNYLTMNRASALFSRK